MTSAKVVENFRHYHKSWDYSHSDDQTRDHVSPFGSTILLKNYALFKLKTNSSKEFLKNALNQ